jgi:hypothetical protein
LRATWRGLRLAGPSDSLVRLECLLFDASGSACLANAKAHDLHTFKGAVMRHDNRLRRTTAVLFSLFVLAFGSGARADVTVTAVGSPSYEPVDFHLFAAPIGTADSGYAEFGETMEKLLPPPHHVFNPDLGIGPGAPHAGPYDHEFADGVAANGYVEGSSFTTAQYSNGSGVWLTFMLVPGAGSAAGSSPDFASGPILPNATFPMAFDGGTYTNGVLNAVLGTFEVPAINVVPGFEDLDGHSHIPMFFADNFDFAFSPVSGSYEYRISLLDAAGNGYQIVAAFEVTPVPEPSTWMLAVGGGLLLGAVLRRRRAADPG